ncbi:MAG: hypothetical protein QOI57_1841 [Rubrobacteraceae bacterium]|nr:hypothetical protein [Rubrobacteraceae bacterium]
MRGELTDDSWRRIEPLLSEGSSRGGQWKDPGHGRHPLRCSRIWHVRNVPPLSPPILL